MTDRQSHPDDRTTRERLTALEGGLNHFRQISDIRNQQIGKALTERNQQIWAALTELKQHNRHQDSEREKLEELLLAKIAEIYAMLWSGMKWLAAFLVTTTFGIILKALGLI